MKITVEFNNLEEVNEFVSSVWCRSKAINGETEVKKETKKLKKKTVVREPQEVEQEVEKVSDMIETAEEVETETKVYKDTEVRAALAKIAKTDPKKVMELLKSFGASNLGEIKEEDYAALMEKAGV